MGGIGTYQGTTNSQGGDSEMKYIFNVPGQSAQELTAGQVMEKLQLQL